MNQFAFLPTINNGFFFSKCYPVLILVFVCIPFLVMLPDYLIEEGRKKKGKREEEREGRRKARRKGKRGKEEERKEMEVL